MTENRHQRRPSQMEQKQLNSAVEIFKNKPEEDKLEALKQIWWELNVHEMERQEFEEEKIQENKKLEEEIERLNLQYGDEVLANIQLNHDKRQSMKLAQRWKEEAEKLRDQLELINEDDNSNDITKNDITNDYIDDSDDMIQGDEDETPGNDLDWEQYIHFIDKIFNSDEEENLTKEEKIDTLKDRVKKVGVELNQSLEENTKLKKQKAKSTQLAEKWRQEAMTLRSKLQNENNDENNNNNTFNTEYNNSVNAPDRKLKQLESVLIEKEEENKKLKHERKESQIAIQSYQQELSRLKEQLFTGNDTQPLNEEDMEDYDNDNVQNETQTNDLLFDQITQGGDTRGGDTKGGDGEFDGEFEHNTEKLIFLSQIEELNNQIQALNKENEKLKGLLNNSSLMPDDNNNNEEELNKLNETINNLKTENNKLSQENDNLKNDKLNLIQNTSFALNQSRELIRKLGQALQNVKS